MTVGEILRAIETLAPAETAESWDNVGLLVGAAEQEVTKAMVCLDITDAVIETAVELGAQLIVSHHPVIFTPMRSLAGDSLPYRLAQKGIAVIAAHTNLDKAVSGVNDRLLEALGMLPQNNADGLCRTARLSRPLSPQELAELVAKRLGTAVRLHAGAHPVRTLAVVGGSGGDYVSRLAEFGADALLTGEVRHHEWLAAGDFTLIDAGHVPTERIVVEPLAEWLRQRTPTVEWHTFEAVTPYTTVTV